MFSLVFLYLHSIASVCGMLDLISSRYEFSSFRSLKYKFSLHISSTCVAEACVLCVYVCGHSIILISFSQYKQNTSEIAKRELQYGSRGSTDIATDCVKHVVGEKHVCSRRTPGRAGIMTTVKLLIC